LGEKSVRELLTAPRSNVPMLLTVRHHDLQLVALDLGELIAVERASI
jgi:hypothetical protein